PYLVADGAGGLYVAGRTTGNPAGGLDGMLLKVSASGKLDWQKYYGGLNVDSFGHGRLDSEGNLYLSGYTMSYGGGLEDGMLTKLSPDGTVLWSRGWGG